MDVLTRPHLQTWPATLPLEVATGILEESNDIVAVAREDGGLLYLNRRGWSLLGRAPGVPLGMLSQLQPEWAWLAVHAEGLPHAVEHGVWEGESAALHNRDGELPVRQRLLVFGEAHTERVVVSIMRDLSEAKRLDVERMELMNRYETAIRMSGHVLLDWEPFSQTLVCSGDLLGLLGCEPGELGCGVEGFRQRIHPEDLPAFDRELQRTVTRRDSLAVAFRVRQRDGDYRSVRAAGGYYLDRSGRFGRITALLTDAELLRSAQRESERLRQKLDLSVDEQVREARLETEQARQAKSEFLSRMSHELRTPLNAILGFTQLLELEDPSESQQESIEHITRAGHHLLSLVNEVLDLSRVESGRLALHLDAVPLIACLHDLLELIRPQAERERITLHTEIEVPATWRVLADPQRLRQVLLNLLTNAVKYNHPGGRITLQCAQGAPQRARISVIDTGPGIPPDKLDRLFNPLEKYGDNTGHGSGVGLGLALTRGLVQAMRGEMGVSSEDGHGSTFWVELPLVDELDVIVQEAVAAAVQVGEVEQPREIQRTKLLYVEDEELNLQLVRRVLEDYPEYSLLTTSRGKEGLQIARAEKPDLILLDLNLPDLSGETVLAQLKDDPTVCTIPVVMITADIVGHRLERLLASGATSYLTKPFKIAELIRIIRDTMAAERRHRRLRE